MKPTAAYHHTDNSQHVWPDEEKPCIWMEAGLVGYKLCDRGFDCEHCSFDAMMSQTGTVPESNKADGRGAQSIFRAAGEDHPRFDAVCRQIYLDPQAYYGKGFWYLKPNADNTVTLGLNDVAAAFLPVMHEVVLPRLNMQVSTDKTAFWLISPDGTIGLRSPCAGRVTRINNRLIEALNQDQESERGNLWLAQLAGHDVTQEMEAMITGDRAAAFLSRQRDQVVRLLENSVEWAHPDLGETSQDGGHRVHSLEQLMGSRAYFRIVASLFS